MREVKTKKEQKEEKGEWGGRGILRKKGRRQEECSNSV
jgi:hypothetical protein